MSKSRSDRWAEAVGELQKAIGNARSASIEIDGALSEVRSIQEEYDDWRGNLPESLEGSPVGEKLEAVCDLEIEDSGSELSSAVDELDNLASEIEGADLPLGFGRD